MEVIVYTDASFCHTTKIGVCGFISLISGKEEKHRLITLTDVKSVNTLELYAVIAGLQHAFLIKGVSRIVVYSDVEDFSKHHFGTHKKWPLHNEYIETLEIIKDHHVVVSVKHVEGHGSDLWNKRIDASCRKLLREKRPPGLFGKKFPEKNNLFGYYDNWH